jgi:hypothetical protein
LNFARSILVNDLVVLYASNGDIYYISPFDGKIIDQKHLKIKFNFVTLADHVILTGQNKLYINRSNK